MDIEHLLNMTGTERDSAMLRLTLSRLLAARGDTEQARAHLEAAVAMEPAYTAAWKELGRLCLAAGDSPAAADAWRRGIERARENGDKQAEREMTVFLRRLQ